MAVAGGKQATDASVIIRHLDRLKAKYDDVVLVHGGGPGVEKTASRWAERNGVHQIVCKPDWDAHGRAAPFRRNDELLDLLPKGGDCVPGLGHHGQSGGQGPQAGDTGPVRGGVNRTHTGRVVTVRRTARPVLPSLHYPPHFSPHRCGPRCTHRPALLPSSALGLRLALLSTSIVVAVQEHVKPWRGLRRARPWAVLPAVREHV